MCKIDASVSGLSKLSKLSKQGRCLRLESRFSRSQLLPPRFESSCTLLELGGLAAVGHHGGLSRLGQRGCNRLVRGDGLVGVCPTFPETATRSGARVFGKHPARRRVDVRGQGNRGRGPDPPE